VGNPPTRVVVAEHQPLLRRALAGLIAEHPCLGLEATASDGDEALSAITATRPDVALIDARLPQHLGQAVLHAMRVQRIDSKVIFLNGHARAQSGAALMAGDSSWISTDSDEDEICLALLAVARGNRPATARPHPAWSNCQLSGRELQILELAASSRSGQAIADDLWLSPATVRTYMNRIYEKLGVSNRAAAVAHGIRHGLIY
jgi:two-component system, NarL family, nitrate/nitrite response regulator NarL